MVARTDWPLLSVQGISRRFGDVQAVEDLSFSIERGGIYGFIGPNGSGKTTTMRILATLDIPDDGEVWVEGTSVLVAPMDARRKLGFMADTFTPYPDLDVEQYLDFFAHAYGLRGRERRRLVQRVSDFCGLGTFLDRPTTGLSKGMGQRLHLAKTMLHDPPLLVLDEPAAGLDPRARIELRELLKALAEDGKGILISSHILAELSEICDEAVVIEAGRLVVAGTKAVIGRHVREHLHVEVRLLEQGARACEKVLLTIPNIGAVVATNASTIRFDYTGDDRGLHALLRELLDRGLPIYSYAPLDVNLEEVFMRSTKGRLQ